MPKSGHAMGVLQSTNTLDEVRRAHRAGGTGSIGGQKLLVEGLLDMAGLLVLQVG